MSDKKTKKRRPRRPNKITAKKYVGRDKISDKSIKININTGGSNGGKGFNIPPAVNVYPQAQHLIQSKNDKTPLIDDKVGTSNLLQLLADKHNDEQRKTRELMDKQYKEQQKINSKQNEEYQLLANDQFETSQNTRQLLDIAQRIPMLKDRPEQDEIPVLRGNSGVMIPPKVPQNRLFQELEEEAEAPPLMFHELEAEEAPPPLEEVQPKPKAQPKPKEQPQPKPKKKVSPALEAYYNRGKNKGKKPAVDPNAEV